MNMEYAYPNTADVSHDDLLDGPGEEDGPWAEGWEERCGDSNIKDGR